MLAALLARRKAARLARRRGETATEDGGVLKAWITFETEVARGYGLVRFKDGADLDAADHAWSS